MNKNFVGVICEYNPFHTGHARQFTLIREKLPDAVIICLMSGCFTQRGMPAMFSPAFRAEAALRAGASVVLELPAAFAVRDAENFALGGVNILNRLGFITHLSFGCETLDLSTLQSVAHLLEHPTAKFHDALHVALNLGKPFAAAQAEAVCAALADHQLSEGLSLPNNILAICYLRALHRLQSKMIPLPVLRTGDYHSQTLVTSQWPSATAVRNAFLAGDISAAEAACGYRLSGADLHRPEALDAVLLSNIRSMASEELKALPDCSEGLENRLQKSAANAVSRTALLQLMKTRRYTHARLNRLLTHAMLDITSQLLCHHPIPEYVRLLGFRKEDEDIFSIVKHSRIPLISKASDWNQKSPLYHLDQRAYDLWALGARLPAGLLYRQKIVII